MPRQHNSRDWDFRLRHNPRYPDMPDPIIATIPPKDDIRFAARMTNIQFAALAAHLRRAAVKPSISELLTRREIKLGAECDRTLVKRWLMNGWNTEMLLRTNRNVLKDGALRHSLHWAFPQAYYSAFSLTLAYFKTVGIPEESHAAAIRRFGAEAHSRRYPDILRVLADGCPAEVIGLAPSKFPSTLVFDATDRTMVETRIAQFLCSTRDIDLDDRKDSVKLLTKSGKRKKSFNADDWLQVSRKLGQTSLLSLLYRKRIKANYRDIDTFLHPELDVESLFNDLINVVGNLNLVHEALIARALGVSFLNNLVKDLPGDGKSGPPYRMTLVDQLAG